MRGFYVPDAKKNYFEGFYFKQVSGLDTVAVIPALHAEEDGRRFASVQVVTDASSGFARIPIEQFEAGEKRFAFRVGKCAFSETGIELNLRTHALEASGRLVFGPLTQLRSPIMGPFEHVPFMQCRHRIVSMAHSVYGTLTVNGRRYTFDSAPGYIEGDRGSSFPARYLWTHHASEKNALSLMLSVADIPFGLTSFTGILCPILWEGKEYRLTTYRGARLIGMGNRTICVKQGAFLFTAELLSENARLLRAPVRGKMERHIRESPSCEVRYLFQKGNATLFDVTAPNASFECEHPAFYLK